MADGYARASGKVGVAMATSGPGATNLVTGICTAMMDSVPVVFITGQVAAHLIGGDAFQETDVTGITLPITKHNYLVTRADQIAETIREAFYIARSGRPGPVLIDICKNAQVESCEFVYPEDVKLPGYQPVTRSPRNLLDQAVALIEKAKKPIILCGHGVLMSKAEEELMHFAVKTQTPVASTLLGLGAFPASHPLSLGMMGMHGEAYTNMAIQNSDLILAFGMRFDDRVTGTLKTYAQKAKKIHIEIDSSEIHKNVFVDVPLVGDVKTVVSDLIPLVDEYDHDEWLEEIGGWRNEAELAQHYELGGRWQVVRRPSHCRYLEGNRRRRDRHHGCGPASDVGCPILSTGKTELLAHVRRCGDDGLWPPFRDWRVVRRKRSGDLDHRR